jgi:hypothetical protein
MSINVRKAAEDSRSLKRVKVFLGSQALDAATNLPVVGQDYILRINFFNYFNTIDAGNTYQKYGMVHAYSGMTLAIFYRMLAESLVRNFAREIDKPLKIYLETGGTDSTVGTAVDVSDMLPSEIAKLTGTYTGIILEEAPTHWVLGKFSYNDEKIRFEVSTDEVKANGDYVIWGNSAAAQKHFEIAPDTTHNEGNGKKIADMEWFYMGERGDIYREMGFPNNFDTKYFANPSKTYDVMNIHYALSHTNGGVERSEKDITIAVPSDVDSTLLIKAVSEATGRTITPLSMVSVGLTHATGSVITLTDAADASVVTATDNTDGTYTALLKVGHTYTVKVGAAAATVNGENNYTVVTYTTGLVVATAA